MTKEQADKLVWEVINAYSVSQSNRGTWYLWQFRDKKDELVKLLTTAQMEQKNVSA